MLSRPLPYRRLTLAAALVLATAPPAPALATTRSRQPAHSSRPHHHKARSHPPVAAPTPPIPPSSQSPITGCPDAWLLPSPENVNRIAAATLCVINQVRAASGLTHLRPVASMTTAATAHSLDMVAGNYLSEVSPSGSSPLQRLSAVGYVHPKTAVDIAENLAAASGPASTPAATVAVWMDDPGARANILSPTYRDTGIGVTAPTPAVTGLGLGATFTEDFGLTS